MKYLFIIICILLSQLCLSQTLIEASSNSSFIYEKALKADNTFYLCVVEEFINTKTGDVDKHSLNIIQKDYESGTSKSLNFTNEDSLFQIYTFSLIDTNIVLAYRLKNKADAKSSMFFTILNFNLESQWDTTILDSNLSLAGSIGFIKDNSLYLSMNDTSENIVLASINPSSKKVALTNYGLTYSNFGTGINPIGLSGDNYYFWTSPTLKVNPKLYTLNLSTNTAHSTVLNNTIGEVFNLNNTSCSYYTTVTEANKSKVLLNTIDLTNPNLISIDSLQLCASNDTQSVIKYYFNNHSKQHIYFPVYRNPLVKNTLRIGIAGNSINNVCDFNWAFADNEDLSKDYFNLFFFHPVENTNIVGLRFSVNSNTKCLQFFDYTSQNRRYTPKMIMPSFLFSVMASGMLGKDAIAFLLQTNKTDSSFERISLEVLPLNISSTVNNQLAEFHNLGYVADDFLILKDSRSCAKLNIYSILGQRLYSDTFCSSTIDLRFLETGIYIAHIQQGNTVQRLKFFKP